MNDFISILQDVWREACRHIEIGESIGRIAPVLVQRMPIEADVALDTAYLAY